MLKIGEYYITELDESFLSTINLIGGSKISDPINGNIRCFCLDNLLFIFTDKMLILVKDKSTCSYDEAVKIYESVISCVAEHTPYRNNIYQLLKSVDKVPENSLCRCEHRDPGTAIAEFAKKESVFFSNKCVYSAVAELKWHISNFPDGKIYQDSIEFDDCDGENRIIHYCYFYYHKKTFVYFREHGIKFCDGDCCTSECRVNFVCLVGERDTDNIGDILADYVEGKEDGEE